jgi:hypothetical protein
MGVVVKMQTDFVPANYAALTPDLLPQAILKKINSPASTV